MEKFGNITLYHADCMEIMKTFSDKQFDLAIVDPPYGLNISNNMGRRKGDKKSTYKKVCWDNEPPDADFFKELLRVSKNQIIWGANHFISRIPLDSPCWLCLDKGFSPDVSFASFELAITSFNINAKRVYIPLEQKGRIHPTQKPVALYAWILNNYASKGTKIIDTHLGSGSICIAANDMGFQLTGIEIDEEYYNAAKKRLLNHQSQLKIFDNKQDNYKELEIFI